MIRRVTAVAVWLTLLHLNLVARDLVCAKHHESAAGRTPSAMQHHVGEGTSQIADVSDSSAPCKVPTRTDCCRAMMSCAVSIGITTAADHRRAAPRRSAVAHHGTERPISRTEAPKTPPPKA